jgi:hypothetical protein
MNLPEDSQCFKHGAVALTSDGISGNQGSEKDFIHNDELCGMYSPNIWVIK